MTSGATSVKPVVQASWAASCDEAPPIVYCPDRSPAAAAAPPAAAPVSLDALQAERASASVATPGRTARRRVVIVTS